jgi:hypothetical protein
LYIKIHLEILIITDIVMYYSGQTDEALSIYLEYVSGGSIHKLLRDYGPFREPVIRNYTRQILSGLAYLHGRNTVHRYCSVNYPTLFIVSWSELNTKLIS